MADRYWVGGTDSWDGTAGTKWAATSGGTGGETVPTTSDAVFFDANSTGTITIASGNTGAQSIDCTGFTGSITGNATLYVDGNVTLATTHSFTYTGAIYITNDALITSAGKAFNDFRVDALGKTVTPADAFTASRRIYMIAGTFDTDGKTITCGTITTKDSTQTRSIKLRTSTVIITTSFFDTYTLDLGIFTSQVGGLEFDAGTSEITFTYHSPYVPLNGREFYNVNFLNATTSTSTFKRLTNPRDSLPATFNNLTFTRNVTAINEVIEISGSIIVKGTLSFQGTSLTERMWLRGRSLSDNGYTPVQTVITANALAADNVTFERIAIAGNAEGTALAGAGDMVDNSGIVFPTPKTVYRVGGDTTWEGVSSWALTSGGTGSDSNYPLVQDTVVIDENTGASSLSPHFTRNFNSSNRTSAITINSFSVTGSVQLSSATTVSGSITWYGQRSNETLSANGATISGGISVRTDAYTLTLGSALTCTDGITLNYNSIFDADTYNVTCKSLNRANVSQNYATLFMGSGLWTLTGTGTLFGWSYYYDILDPGTADIILTNTSTSSRSIYFSASTPYVSLNKITIGGTTGTSTLTLYSDLPIQELLSTKTVAHTITLGNNQSIGTWSVSGSSGNLVTVQNSSMTLTNPTTSSIDYLSVKNHTQLSKGKFYVGENSTNLGGNTDVYFVNPDKPPTMMMMF